MLKAAQIVKDEAIGEPILLGRIAKIQELIEEHGFDFEGVDLSGAYLEQVDFTGANLRGSNLSGAILSRAIFKDCDLNLINHVQVF